MLGGAMTAAALAGLVAWSGPVDPPRSRGSHQRPTPTAAGISASSPYHRPVSRDSSAGSQGSSWNSLGVGNPSGGGLSVSSTGSGGSAGLSSASAAAKSRLPRTSTANVVRRPHSRLGMAAAASSSSTANAPIGEKVETPTRPPSASSRSSAAIANARSRRRQTGTGSGGVEGWRQ